MVALSPRDVTPRIASRSGPRGLGYQRSTHIRGGRETPASHRAWQRPQGPRPHLRLKNVLESPRYNRDCIHYCGEMMATTTDSKAVYIRMPAELKDRVESYAQERGWPLTDAVEELLRQGLESRDSTDRLRQRVEAVEGLIGQIQASKNTAEHQLGLAKATADSYRSQMSGLQLQLDQVLTLPVARCKYCPTIATVREVVSKRCANGQCSHAPGFDLLPEYVGEKGAWDAIRDISAVIGGIAVAAAAINALEQQR